MNESKTVEAFLTFLRDSAQTSQIASEDEAQANDETQDILHRLELCNDAYRDTARLARTLREVRRRRRRAKDAREKATVIAAWAQANRTAVNQLEHVLGDLRKLEKRNEQRFYNPRTHICDREAQVK